MAALLCMLLNASVMRITIMRDIYVSLVKVELSLVCYDKHFAVNHYVSELHISYFLYGLKHSVSRLLYKGFASVAEFIHLVARMYSCYVLDFH